MKDKKILIVDDEDEAAGLLKELLVNEGFSNFDYAPDTLQAVRKAHLFKPDLILLDIQMPGGGGIEVLRRLRQSEFTARIPVIVITGIKDAETKAKFFSEGMCTYFSKPYKPEMLVAEIKGVFARRNSFAGVEE